MKWTLGFLSALLAAGAASPSSRLRTSTSVNMSQEDSPEPIKITTQNIFGDVVSVTPPDTESIELHHLNDDTQFYPDYGDKDPVDDHFPDSQDPSRTKRQSLDYNDLTYEMYIDPTYTRKRRDVDQPFRIDLAIPGDSESLSSDVQTVRSRESHPDSASTQITYVVISEDDSSEKDTKTDTMVDHGEHTTEVIDLFIPSSEEGTTSSSSADSIEERKGAIAHTERQRSNADGSSSSSASTRKRRQIPYYRLPDFLNYRVGRSASDSDDTEPDDAHGLNMKDLSMDAADLKLVDGEDTQPEFSYEFSELTRPSSTHVNGKLQSYYVPDRQKRSLETTTEPDVDIVTASYPLGIDATKDNLSLPEGNFLGPRIYAKGDLLQEEQPAGTEITVNMEREESIPVEDGSQTETVYSDPIQSMNLPLIIPVVGPTSHPGEEPRIELSVPSGYVPYIIQLSPTNNPTSENKEVEEQPSQTENRQDKTTTTRPEAPTYLSFVPTIIVTPSTPTEAATKINVMAEENIGLSSGAELGPESSHGPSTVSLDIVPTTKEDDSTSIFAQKRQSLSKQKRADWKSISSAPVGEIVEPRGQTSSWKQVPVGEEELPKQQTPRWESNIPVGAEEEKRRVSGSVSSKIEAQSTSWKPVPLGEVELPKQQTARWEPVSNSPVGEAVSFPTPTSSSISPESISLKTNMDSEKSDQPSASADTKPRKRIQPIPILEKNSVMSSNGSFSYSFKSGNGIQVEESGYLKKEAVKEGSTDREVAQAVQGSYSYPSPDGRIISVRYVADEKGFRPEVEDLPN